MNPKLLGALILAAGAALTYCSNTIVRKVFRSEDPAADKRSIAIKTVGLLTVIAGMLVIFEMI